MCFILSDDSKPIIAKEDIVCYKIVERIDLSSLEQLTSLFANYIYTVGELNPKVVLNILESIKGSYLIEKGYHSYIRKPIKYSYNSAFFGKREIVECTIPKGTLYYANEFEYVSENIIINKIL